MHIKYIKGNVKEGVETPLGPRTLIVGENGSGKSSIVNAVELALGGFASDVNGREIVRKTSDLITLKTDKPKKEKVLSVEGVLSNDTKASWQCKQTPSGAGKATHNIPKELEVRFPFQEVKENLTGSAATARRYLLSLLPIEHYLSQAPGNVRIELELQQKANSTAPIGEHLQAIVEISKRRIKDAKAEIKARTISKDLIGKGLIPTTAEEVEEAHQESQSILAQIMEQGKQISLIDLERAKDKASMLATQLNEMDEAIEAKPPNPLTEQEKADYSILSLLYGVCEYHEKNNRQNCLVCDGHLGNAIKTSDVDAVLDGYRQRENHHILYRDLVAKRDLQHFHQD